VGVLSVERDITGRKRAEEALRAGEARLAEAERIAHLGNWERKIGTNELLWSVETYRVFGRQPDQFTPTHEAFLDAVHPDDRRDVQESFDRTLSEGGPYSIEHRIVLPNGDVRIVQERGEVTLDQAGKPTRALGTVQDVTERKRMNEQLPQAQKMETVGRLAGGMAHDFNNLLTTIIGFTEFVLSGLDEGSPLREDLEQVRRAGRRASSLTSQLLAFSRRQLIKPRILDLNFVVNDMGKMLGRLIGEDIELDIATDPELGRVQADPGQIEQVIMNLTVNARDAMPDGGKLTIRTHNVTVDVDYCAACPDGRPGQFVCLLVEDAGSSMDEDTARQILEPFFTTKDTGTGLGLAVVYGIIKQHEGWITVDSEPVRGSTFQVYLPASYLEAEYVPGETILPAGFQSGGERILVVEDDEDVHKFAVKMLREKGYEVFGAFGVAEALEIFEAEDGRFDLVFSDVVLSDGTGLDLVDRIHSRQPDTRVLLSSGYADHKSQWSVISERGYPFLQKPSSLAELMRGFSEALALE
jgi:two-component system cell cycle sensor histidine kinase/response regulator CckA